MSATTMRLLLHLLEDPQPTPPSAAVPPAPAPGLVGTLDIRGLAQALAVPDVGHFTSAMQKVQNGRIDLLGIPEKAQLVCGFINLLRSDNAGKYAVLHKISGVQAPV